MLSSFRHCHQRHFAHRLNGSAYHELAGGWAIAAGELQSSAGRGKSELRRAVCRITSGTEALKLRDGKCHREYTAASARMR